MSENFGHNQNLNQAPNSMTGRILDRWEILDAIGEGGMSEVYRARHVIMNKIGAVKFLKADLSQDENAVKRFQQEAMTSGSLAHTNVVQVYDCGASEHGFYLILEFLEGLSLADLLDSRREGSEDGRGRLSLEEAVPIFLKVCRGLGHAHAKGIVHRDMKPSNIMLIQGGGDIKDAQVKLVDFGIAKFVQSAGREAHSLTKTGEVFGSPVYMSPEQCMGKAVDGRADVYSLGCLMFEALTGRKLINGRNATETMIKHVEEKPDLSLLERMAAESEAYAMLKTIVERCLEKDPNNRFADMEELEESLLAIPLVKASDNKNRKPDKNEKDVRLLIFSLVTAAVATVLVMSLAVYSLWPVARVQEHLLQLKLPLPPLGYRPAVPPGLMDRKTKILLNDSSLSLVSGDVKAPNGQTLKSQVQTLLAAATLFLEEKNYLEAGSRYSKAYERLKEFDKCTYDQDGSGNRRDKLVSATGAVWTYYQLDRLKKQRALASGLAVSSRPSRELVESEHTLEDLLDEAEIVEKGDPLWLNRAYTVFAMVLEEQQDLVKAMEVVNKDLKLDREVVDGDPFTPYGWALKKANLAELCRITEKFDREKDPYENALADLEKAGYGKTPQEEKVMAQLRFHHGLYLLELEHAGAYKAAFEEFSRALPTLSGVERSACAGYAYESIKHYDWFGSLLFRFKNAI
ncbi:MAG TPA: serine/threonine-protein kinase [Candidatus Obscuribacter sp.]|nr:serine/threonine-protein kinase [Candidatus Obscuribacter sp.]